MGYVSEANLEPNKFYLIASHFQETTGAAVDIQDFISSNDMLGGTDDTDSPNLKLWIGTGYQDYIYLAQDFMGAENVWSDDGMLAAEDVPVNLGDGAFLKVKNACTITVAGQVAAADSMNVPLKSGSFNLIANPFPVAFDLNGDKVDFAGALIGGTDDTDSPNLKLWIGTGYQDYIFLATDFMGAENVWSDDGMLAAEGAVVLPGHGFWVKYTNNPSDVNLKFNK